MTYLKKRKWVDIFNNSEISPVRGYSPSKAVSFLKKTQIFLLQLINVADYFQRDFCSPY